MNQVKNFNMQGKEVLVTGGAGAIGKNLVRLLLQHGAKVTVIDNLSSSTTDGLDTDRVVFFQGDISDDLLLEKVFLNEYNYVFHAAAHFANQNSVEHPIIDLGTNIAGTVKLLEKVKSTSIERFIYFNTSCMYGGGTNFSEDDVDFEYHTPYSISKYAGEQYVMLYDHLHGVPATSIRIFNSYGPHEYSGKYRNVIPNFIDLALRKQSLPVMGDGTDTRSFTYVDDLIEGVLSASGSELASGQIINIGNDVETTTLELAQLINELTDNAAPITFVPKRPWDKAKRRKADLSKAKKMLHYQPTTNLKEGLKKTIEWYKNSAKHL